ncbi:Uncharacterized conserved protein YecT, DUF1311 family [Thiothrix caldifontis]|uniref:Uncharacterized conserved protein YecT, DUF1311 family n=1 Tax=Thiothrix caldifontis TaxID=525918 RepID=A0A1H4DA85_9GAMM|nr:lysozyme inhibitor LprI family protein [Thiothrix caldifontis]SEA69309.1 Uncharacterized conserved protein YecT, DUF1311 family [Thiothrix caldifontis]
MRYVLVFACALVIALPVQAKTTQHTIDLTTESCLSTNDSTAGMLECFSRAEKDWDTELNRVYKALQSKLKPAAQDALKQAQRAWIVQRDKEFEFINAIHAQMDGTMWIAVMAGERADVVKARVVALQDYLDLLEEGAQ